MADLTYPHDPVELQEFWEQHWKNERFLEKMEAKMCGCGTCKRRLESGEFDDDRRPVSESTFALVVALTGSPGAPRILDERDPREKRERAQPRR